VIYCQTCGAENQAGARFCAKCGSPLDTGVSPVPSAAGGGKTRGGLVLVAVIALLVVLVFGAGTVAFAVFGPMSEGECEDAVQDYAGDIYDAQYEIDSSVYVMYFTMDALENDSDVPFTEDELDSGEVSAARDAFDDGSETIQAAAAALEELRPPKAYRSEDESLLAWSEFMLDEWLPQYEELVQRADDGMTYAEFSEDYDALMESLSEDSDGVWDDYYEAADELHID